MSDAGGVVVVCVVGVCSVTSCIEYDGGVVVA